MKRRFLAAVALAACLCGPTAPPRPAVVPSAAVWHGGFDGGAFFLFDPARPDGAHRCRVYGDQSGELLFDGVVRGPGPKPVDLSTARESFAFDGESILLASDRLDVLEQRAIPPPR